MGWIIGGLVLWAAVLLFGLALCKVAGDADDQLEAMWLNMQAEQAARALAELSDDGN